MIVETIAREPSGAELTETFEKHFWPLVTIGKPEQL